MRREQVLLCAYGLLLGVIIYEWTKRQGDTATDNGNEDFVGDVGIEFESAAASAANFLDSATGGFLKISAMRSIDMSVLTNPNVQAILRVIRTGEGTTDDQGYRRIFGGQLFSSYADHPRVSVTKGGYTSTAAGAYQMLASTWDETRKMMGLTDFSPASQDAAAVGRIAARGALDDVLAGRFDTAIKKINREWASLPGSPYGQPVMTWDKARAVYASAGGDMGAYA
ncbi:MAG TPA: glycoside hydrolase family 104 protein [Noviherbaspirillum sp.]|uniref:glycoside hydrolase family 24 protein n=1 Tax=Noviherbaspirillum sp. TaxID=1926288 RepID=UPI002B490FE6|nr:glycoside hydrolase family 104 protein [Noviherbaspirillum sp.]HJV86916.1 glycoside hydrolase family 104 protein [Noviherbaspirillum sp.]